ncbi:MAG TPA: transglycosylase SLT domain-containing protein [Steroidobacteraceae bacterium]
MLKCRLRLPLFAPRLIAPPLFAPPLFALLLLALLLCGQGSAAEAPAVQTAVRAEFIAALRRETLNQPEVPDSPALQHYVIYPYLIAARLGRELQQQPGEAVDSEVDAFLRQHGTEPVAHELRTQWLSSLAERSRWELFLPRATNLTQPALICDRLAGRLATGDTSGLSAEALARWELPQKQPAECDSVFAWLQLHGQLTPERIESRARAALAADNPRFALEVLAQIPAQRAIPLLQWAQLLQNPKTVLQGLAADPASVVESAALRAGFTKLSRTDAASALELLPKLLARPQLTPALRSALQRAAALGAAYGRNPAAIAAFAALPADAIDTDVYEWRVRAALWADDFPIALQWIAQMPPQLSAQPRWRYWRARALLATGDRTAAKSLFDDLAGTRDFYGYLAADRLHRGYSLNAHPSLDDGAVQSALEDIPAIQRAHELFDCGMSDAAMLEWASALTGTDSTLRLQAAHLAAHWGWYAQSIAMLAQLGELDDVRLRYPRPYLAAIDAAARLAQLPPDWILAVMRQESLFRRDALSHAGARGLMQMQPATAAAVAHRWRLPLPGQPTGTVDASVGPGVDVTLGAAYLRELLDKYGGQLGVSLAAYNAGQVPVARWLPGKPLDADIWIENIPYGETRAYVQHIFEHIVAFAWVRNATPERLSALMPPVEPTAYYAQSAQPASVSGRAR